MLGRPMQRGVTLIELLIGLVVFGVLIMLGAPSFGAWMQNMQIRSGAESILNGLQVARTEAVSRNLAVQVVLGPGSGWTITEVATGTQIQQRFAEEGSATASVVVTPGAATTITFNGMGWVVGNNDLSASISEVDVASTVMNGTEIRPLRIQVGRGGGMKMCDPAVAAGDPRAC